MMVPNPLHGGSTFDDFLEEEGIRAEVEAVALKRVMAWQLAQAMEHRHLSKAAMARAMKTSRSQVDRLLDPENDALTLHTLTRAALTLGLKVEIHLSTLER
jgi:predicted XRE-type DNA-binding protein